jgi:hypothetical protein
VKRARQVALRLNTAWHDGTNHLAMVAAEVH